jgi:hypothetical protein
VELRLHALLYLIIYTVRHKNSELEAGFKTRSSFFWDVIQRRLIVPTFRENISVSSSTARQSWTGGIWNCARRVTTVSGELYGKMCMACCHSVWLSVWQIMHGVLPQCLAICTANCVWRVTRVSGYLYGKLCMACYHSVWLSVWQIVHGVIPQCLAICMANYAWRVATVSGHLYGKLCMACCHSVWPSVWQIVHGVLPQCLAISMANCARGVAAVSGDLYGKSVSQDKACLNEQQKSACLHFKTDNNCQESCVEWSSNLCLGVPWKETE